jgi:hypothetical protein
MKEFKVYFEIFGKKMVTEVEANSAAEARQKVIDKMIFHKVVMQDGDTLDNLKKMFGMT